MKHYISVKEPESREAMSDAGKLREIREWHKRLVAAHRGGYRLADASVETVLANVGFLLRQLGGRI